LSVISLYFAAYGGSSYRSAAFLSEDQEMIKVMMTQRRIPPGFDTRDETQVARHARYAVDAMASLGGRMHWICTYITEDSPRHHGRRRHGQF
jgi:hypothetical protein